MSKDGSGRLPREWRFYLEDLGIDNDTLWSIMQSDIPHLLKHLARLKENGG